MKTTVCFDTNILFRIMTQSQDGCEIEHWQKIQDLAKVGKITVLVLQVVLPELGKLTNSLGYSGPQFRDHSVSYP